MTGRLDEHQRQIAAQLGHDYPNWVILWGLHTRLYWAFPTFAAPLGTIIAAPAPRQLTMRMQATEHATSASTWATPREKRP
jgi:hypothetical protein